MAIFPEIEIENTIQVDDKTRIDVSATFVSKGEAAITLVEIQPSATDLWYDVTGSSNKEWFFDWAYQGTTSRAEVVSFRVTTDGSPVTLSKNIEVISEADDLLFSNDDDLKIHEPLIMNWIKDGRNTYLDASRKAQYKIMDYLDRNGYRKANWEKLTKNDLFDLEEVREWSTFWALSIISKGRSNAVGDIFFLKAEDYKSLSMRASQRVFRAYDWNNNGQEDPGEKSSRTNEIDVERV